MADTMQFDLVSPERKLASVEASEVRIPGAEGDMTAMPDHAATITTLRPGVLKVVSAEGTQEYLVTGGFAEITPTSTSVLAEQAVPRAEVTQDSMDKLMSEAAAARDSAAPDAVDNAIKYMADLASASQEFGLSVRS
ncbi:MAG: F0F1 ATP synthase subunit epsilon [Paracoccaceae bacterium]